MILTINDPIYVQSVVVAIAEKSVPRILRAVVRAGYKVADAKDLTTALKMGELHGCTVGDPDSGAVIIRLLNLRRGNVEDIWSLVHECVHAGTMLFARVGFPLRAKTDEPFAYYVSFLVKEVLEKAGQGVG